MRTDPLTGRLTARPAGRAALLGLLCALAVALSALEALLPALPFPGARVGFANLATMYALSALSLPAALCVTAVRAAFALLRGATACLMSAAGGLLSTLVMAAALRWGRHLSFIGVGILGAVAHNVAQWLLALLLMNTVLTWYLPFLLISALIAGAFTGLTVNLLRRYF